MSAPEGNEMVVKTADELADEETPGLVFPSPYFEMMGDPAPNFSALLYGRPGSGKSTLAVGLCRAVLPYLEGTDMHILYCSAEEGPGGTSSERMARMGVDSDRVAVSNFRGMDDLREYVDHLDAQLVIVDSVSYIEPRTDKALSLVNDLHDAGRASVMIAHQNSKGKPKMATDLEHACFAVFQCEETKMGLGEAKKWGIDYEDPKRQVQDGEVVAHLANVEKNRYGAIRQYAPIPMKGAEIREEVPGSVIDASIDELAAAGRWPPDRIARSNERTRPEGTAPVDSDAAGPTAMSVKVNPAQNAGVNPESDDKSAREGRENSPSSNGTPTPEDVDAMSESAPSPTPSDESTDRTHSNDTSPMSTKPTSKTRTSQTGPGAATLRAVRTNPVDLSEKDSFTLGELIENNGNAARSISYLNRFIGWERGCVAEVSKNEVPAYRDEEGAETVTGKLLSFTYERFGKTSSRPRPVAIVRMYLNDQLEATFCARTARECIEEIKEEYGDLRIRVESQQHLKDALGAEEYRRLESEIPLRQDEDREEMPEDLEETGPEESGFASDAVSPRGHIDVQRGLVDARVQNLVEAAARGELRGAGTEAGDVLGPDLQGSGATQRVELFGEVYHFYPTEQFQLERSTGDTMFVGDEDSRGSSERAEELLAFNFGMETESEQVLDEETIATGPPAEEEEPADEEPEEEPEPTGFSMDDFEERLDDVSLEEEETGVFVFRDDRPPTMDSKTLSVLEDVADESGPLDVGSGEGNDRRIEIMGVELQAFELKTPFTSSQAENPGYSLEVDEGAPVTAEDILMTMSDSAVSFKQTPAALAAEEPEGEEEAAPRTEAPLDERLEAMAADASEQSSAPGGYGHGPGGDIVIGEDARTLLRPVVDSYDSGTLVFDADGERYEWSLDEMPTLYVRSPDNGAFALRAQSEAAEELGPRGFVQAMAETGALSIESVNTRTETTEVEEPEPEPETEPEPDEGEVSEDVQDIMGSLNELNETMDQL